MLAVIVAAPASAAAKRKPSPPMQCVYALSFADDLVNLHQQYIVVNAQGTQAAFDHNTTALNVATQQILALNGKYATAKSGFVFAEKQCLAGK
jgi:hypothetical protein